MLLRRPALIILLLAPACREPERQAEPPPAAAPPAAAPASVMGAIVANNVAWGDALVRGDSSVLSSIYADDAVLMLREGDVTGQGAIVTTLMSARRSGGDSIHGTATSTDQLDVAGDRAYEAGTLTYTLISAGGTTRKVRVRYANFWQLAAGTWQLHRSLRPLP
jgi:ketosteroid isomerase-like protein